MENSVNVCFLKDKVYVPFISSLPEVDQQGTSWRATCSTKYLSPRSEAIVHIKFLIILPKLYYILCVKTSSGHDAILLRKDFSNS
jgi:hypothetical protein